MQAFCYNNVTVTLIRKGRKMKDADQAFYECCRSIKDSIVQIPEFGEEYASEAWGVFSMWMAMSGYLPHDENDTIAANRDYVEGIQRFGAAMQKKAGV